MRDDVERELGKLHSLFAALAGRVEELEGDAGSGGGTITVEEVDGNPSVADVTTLRVHQADGFVVSSPGAGIARIDLADVPGTVLDTSIAGHGLDIVAGVLAVDETELDPSQFVDATVYEANFSALANQDFVAGGDNVYVIDGINWTVANTANANSFAIVNGTGLQIATDGTAATFNSGTQTAPYLYATLGDLVPNYNPLRSYVFEIQFANLILENSTERLMFGLWGVAGAPASSANRMRAAAVNNSTGTLTWGIVNNTTPGGNVIAIGSDNVLAFRVNTYGLGEQLGGSYAGGWPALLTQHTSFVTLLAATDPMLRAADTRVAIALPCGNDASPTSTVDVVRMRIREVA